MNVPDILNRLLLSIASSALLLTSCGEEAKQTPPPEADPTVSFICTATRNVSYNSAKCQRETADGMVDCEIAPSNCARDETKRAIFCDKLSVCRTYDDAKCENAEYGFDSSCQDLATSRDACLNDWKTQCEAIRLPDGTPAGCMATWNESPCETKKGQGAAVQCKEACGDVLP
ncbi:hypothetical protein [Permianibacter aggregans]|uniref:Lipoprotein n=1 Tax=Permianibacter aggregans TaxID=1510150 RepID=A0A4R6USW6_9GAMM|nr:hypothetical protein [Permianibacter aggregans]QGX40761.1 hypothetical protein E2H98_14280 [Permianibacter aggregans]TDQ48425.1 hypothetical protein EV696_107162 [Permianibacter aggregans]